MRWFKHLTSARHDEAMAELLDEFGAEGYGMWWIILEMIGRQMDKTNKCSARYSLKKWSKACIVSTKKFQKVVSFLSKLEKLSIKTCQKNSNFLIIECPNLLKFRDEYSKKSRQAPDKRQTKSGVTPEQKQKQKQKDISLGQRSINQIPEPNKCSPDQEKKKESDFEVELTDAEKKHKDILRKIWHVYHPELPTNKKLILEFIDRAVALKINPEEIAKAARQGGIAQTLAVLATVEELKTKIEAEGKPVKSITGLFVRMLDKQFISFKETEQLENKGVHNEIDIEKRKRESEKDPPKHDLPPRQAAIVFGNILKGVDEHIAGKQKYASG